MFLERFLQNLNAPANNIYVLAKMSKNYEYQIKNYFTERRDLVVRERILQIELKLNEKAHVDRKMVSTSNLEENAAKKSQSLASGKENFEFICVLTPVPCLATFNCL